MPRAEWTAAQRHGALLLVCFVGIFNLMDRQVMTILLEPIKLEFKATDTEMGLLTGGIFAFFYAGASIPLARLADRFPRKMVIGGSLAAWSVLTSLGGLASSFTQLASTRLGVAIGEAGSGAPTYSILADLYELKHRAKAYSCYSAATSIGIGGAVIIGGWLVDAIGWRLTLVAVGAPGVILSLIVFTMLREPVRGMADNLAETEADRHYGFWETLRHLFTIRTFPFLILICGLGGTGGYGLLTWGPSFLIRAHGMSPADVGIYFGSMSIVALVLGQLITGVVLDIAARHDLRAYMWFAGGGLLLCIPFGLRFTLANSWWLSIIGFGLLSFLISPHNMCGTVIAQTLAPPRMRATASMIIGLGTALFGTGFGPMFIGMLNDLLIPRYGPLAIRYSISAALIFFGLSATAALIAARFVRADHARLHAYARDGMADQAIT